MTFTKKLYLFTQSHWQLTKLLLFPTGDNSPAFINKTLQNALNAANLSPSELAKALQIEKV